MKAATARADNDKHARIIEAAIRVFANKGFHNSKVADVAREADVADGTIYLYFKSKDDLLICVFEDIMRVLIEAVRSRLQEMTDPVDKVKTFIRVHLELVAENPELAQVVQLELRQSSKFMKEYRPERFFEYLSVLRDILEEGKRTGAFRSEVKPAVIQRAIFGAIDEMALEWVLMHRKKYTLEEAAKQIGDLVVGGIVNHTEVRHGL